MIFNKNKTLVSSVLKLLTGLFVVSAFMLMHNHAALAAPCAYSSTDSPTNDWQVAASWSCGHVPTASDDVTIPAATTTNLNADAVAQNVTIGAGSTLTMNDHNLSFVGDWADSGTLVPGTGIVVLNGTGAQAVSAEANFGALTINKSLGTATLGGNVTTTGTLTLQSGTLDLDTYTMFVGGNWNNSGGTLDAGTGMVDFNSATGDQEISAEPNFYDLTISNVVNTVSLAGNVSVAHNVTTTGAGTLNATTRTLTVGGSVIVGAGTTVTSTSGTLTLGALVTNNGNVGSSSGNILTGALLNNGGATFSVGSGSATSTGIFNNGGTFNGNAGRMAIGGAFLNTGTFNAGTGSFRLTGATSYNVTGVTFYNLENYKSAGIATIVTNPAVVGGALTTSGAGTLNSAALALSVTGASTIGSGTTVTSTSGDLTFTGAVTNAGSIGSVSGDKLFGSTLGNTGVLDVGTGVATTTGNLTNTGTVYGRTGKLAMVANYSGAGTFTAGTGTVTFYGSANQAVRGVTFYNLETRKSAGTVTVNTANMIVGGVFDTYDAGTLSASTFNFSVTGVSTIRSGATVTSTSGTITLTGAVVNAGSIGSSTGNMLFGGLMTNTGTVNVGSGTATTTGNFNGVGNLNGNSGTFVLIGSSDGNTTFDAGTGTFKYAGTADQALVGGYTYNNLIIHTDGAATADAAVTIGGTLAVRSGSELNSAAFTADVTGVTTNAGTVTSTSGDLTFGAVTNSGSLGTVSGNQILTNMTNSGTWELGAESTSTGALTNTGTILMHSNTLHVGGNWTDSSGTLTPGTGIIEINGTGAQSISADDTMYALTINKTAGTATLTGNVTTTDDLTITNGTLDIDSYTFSVGDDYSNGDTLDGGTGTVKFNGTGAQSIGTEANFYALTISKTAGTATMIGHVSTTNLTVTDGTLAVADKILYAPGTYTNADTITETTGTIKHDADQIAFVNSSGVVQTSYTTPSSVYFQVEDPNKNLLGGTAETLTISVAVNLAGGSDSESMTLTETGVATGIFRSAALPLYSTVVVHAANGELDINHSGTGTLTYTDSQDDIDTDTSTASLVYAATASTGGTGGGGGGGGGLLAVTTEYQSSQSDPNRTANLANLTTKNLSVNSLVKLPDDGNLDTQEDSAVYFIGTDGKRHAFPNSKVYFTWYSNFDGVTVISAGDLASLPLGSNARYKPGSKMIKFTTDPKVYADDAHGSLRWVKTEDMAKSLYGSDWNTKIDDMSDAFFGNYSFGSDINSSSDFSPAAVMSSILTVSDDYGW